MDQLLTAKKKSNESQHLAQLKTIIQEDSEKK